MARRFVVQFIAIALSLLLLAAAAVFVIDPLYQYHTPWFGLGMPLFSERYQNAGLARQMEYDAVILGSSMVESNRARWYNAAFDCRTLKLSIASAFLSEYDQTLSLIYQRQTLDYVFLCLDVYPLTDGGGFTWQSCPAYLYDNDPLNDVKYIWNRDVLLDTFPQYFEGCKAPAPLEDAFAYADRVSFGRSVSLTPHLAWRSAVAPAEAQLPRDTYLESCSEALTGITGHIAAHPETTYYIFFPPYSAIYWDKQIRLGLAEAQLSAVRQAAETLTAYLNVRLFCFLGAEEYVCDLERYSDAMHFDRATSESLVSDMRSGVYEVTSENCAAVSEALEDWIMRLDYDALFYPEG